MNTAPRAKIPAIMPLDALSDSELVEACLDGKAEAWEVIVRRFRRLVYSVPARMGLKGEDADEVFQDTFTTLLQKIGQVKDRDRIGLWLAVTARRKALDRVSRGHAVKEVGLPETFEAEDPRDLPVDELMRLERRNLLRNAFDQIDGRCKDLLGALYFEDPSPPYKEIAKRMKMPEGSLGPTRMRCFKKLQKLLGPR